MIISQPPTTLVNDDISYRRSLSSFPTGVAILTATRVDGSTYGVTISSLVSISMNPRLVGWALQNDRTATRFFSECRFCRIHVLDGSQSEVARRFAGPISLRPPVEDMPVDDWGSPIILGAIAHFCCEVEQKQEIGDHQFFIAKVLGFSSCPAEDLASKDPLIYFSSILGWSSQRLNDAN